jgi:hypothetical protein
MFIFKICGDSLSYDYQMLAKNRSLLHYSRDILSWVLLDKIVHPVDALTLKVLKVYFSRIYHPPCSAWPKSMSSFLTHPLTMQCISGHVRKHAQKGKYCCLVITKLIPIGICFLLSLKGSEMSSRAT